MVIDDGVARFVIATFYTNDLNVVPLMVALALSWRPLTDRGPS